MIQRALLICLGVATLAMDYGFAVTRHWIFVLAITIGGLFWFYGWARKLEGISSLFLVGYTLITMYAILVNLPPYGFLVALIATLSAWDLDRFDKRIQQVGRIENERAVVQKHFLSLAIVDGLGLVLGIAALVLRVRLDFGLILLLGLIAVIGLSLVFNAIKREISRLE